MTTMTMRETTRTERVSQGRSKMPYVLWSAQVLLALTFLVAGSTKFIMPAEDLTKDSNLSGTFLRFIGACEVLGALGLILPGLLRIRRGLTPLAATGLVIIMAGAVVVTVSSMGVAPALFPLAVGTVVAFVAYGRRDWLRAA